MKTLEISARIDIQNILFPTDFSPVSDKAIPYATEFAKRFGAALCALHVRPPVINPMTEPATWGVLEKNAQEEADAQKKLLLKFFPEIKPEIMIEEGDFWQILETTIENHHTDLIVLGTRGRSGAGKFFLGSKAEEIFRRASCAVLTVGPHSQTEAPRNGDIAEILYATDFSPESSAAASYAISLAEEFKAHLTLLHVIAEPKPGNLVSAAELVAASERRLREMVPADAEIWCAPQFAVAQGPVAEKILAIGNRKDADLIILGVRRPTGFPGAATHLPIATAHKVVAQARCPVLTVRE